VNVNEIHIVIHVVSYTGHRHIRFASALKSHLVLDSELSKECIDSTVMYIFFSLYVVFLETIFRDVEMLRSLCMIP